jgi:type IV pilus assembly protein PilV
MRNAQEGVVLIEVLLATLIFAIGIMAVIGLQAAAIGNVADAKYRMDASAIAGRMMGVMWANQSGLTAGTTMGTVDELPNGNSTTTVVKLPDPIDATKTIGYAVTVLIEWHPPNMPGSTPHRYSAVANIYPG